MLVRCNSDCRQSDGNTDASLDVKSNEAICNKCGDIISGVSKFSKLSMKSNGDIIRRKASKAFSFPCTSCDKIVEAVVLDGKVLGKGCDTQACEISITKSMRFAVEYIAKKPLEVSENE